MRERLEQLISEMVAQGIRYEDARREFDKHFITQVVARCGGNLGEAARTLDVHRNTLTRKIQELKIRAPKDSLRS